MSNGSEAAERSVARLRECFEDIKTGMARSIVGQEEVVKLMAVGMFSGGHMLLIGVPGLAKTLMVKSLSMSLGWDFRRIQFTPDLMPSDITGTEILQGREGASERELVFRRGPIFANLILADEINRTPPKTQAALLEAMQEHAVTVSGKTHPLEPPFTVVATQNPIEQEGTYPLPEAQLDRFMLSIHVGYPSREHEASIAARPLRAKLEETEQVADKAEFLTFMDVVDSCPASAHVLEYVVRLASASRPKDESAEDYVKRYVSWGVGPRATQHLVTAAKALALLEGRPAPEVRDVRAMALPVLRHRIIPNYNALGEGIDSADIVRHLLETVREPVAAGA